MPAQGPARAAGGHRRRPRVHIRPRLRVDVLSDGTVPGMHGWRRGEPAARIQRHRHRVRPDRERQDAHDGHDFGRGRDRRRGRPGERWGGPDPAHDRRPVWARGRRWRRPRLPRHRLLHRDLQGGGARPARVERRGGHARDSADPRGPERRDLTDGQDDARRCHRRRGDGCPLRGRAQPRDRRDGDERVVVPVARHLHAGARHEVRRREDLPAEAALRRPGGLGARQAHWRVGRAAAGGHPDQQGPPRAGQRHQLTLRAPPAREQPTRAPGQAGTRTRGLRTCTSRKLAWPSAHQSPSPIRPSPRAIPSLRMLGRRRCRTATRS